MVAVVVVGVVVLLTVDVNATDDVVDVVSSPTFIIELPGPLS